jgi:effector-binding domain-containing protein
MKRKNLWLAILPLITGCLVAGCSLTRAGYESPAYKASEQAGACEVRTYERLVIVTAPMKDLTDADGSFMRLFRYISKDNDQKQSVAMTTPVLMTESDKGAGMSFIVPEEMIAKGVPKPNSPDMSIEIMPAARYAVIRFNGQWQDKERLKGFEKELRAYIAARKLKAAGSIIVAGYDPPFTPPALRRNEILLRLE